jgi:hypothetical protein
MLGQLLPCVPCTAASAAEECHAAKGGVLGVDSRVSMQWLVRNVVLCCYGGALGGRLAQPWQPGGGGRLAGNFRDVALKLACCS